MTGSHPTPHLFMGQPPTCRVCFVTEADASRLPPFSCKDAMTPSGSAEVTILIEILAELRTIGAGLKVVMRSVLAQEVRDMQASEAAFAQAKTLLKIIAPCDGYEAPVQGIPNEFQAQVYDQLVSKPVRLSACIERWPECASGAYDPRCCRFPKACSCV